MGLEPGIHVFPKGAAPANDILPKPGLRFMHPCTSSASERGSLIRPVNALLIHRMARFVHVAKKTIAKIIFLNAGRDAHVPQGELRHERMVSLVNATAREIITQLLNHFCTKR